MKFILMKNYRFFVNEGLYLISENKIPPFKERTFIQHVGRLMDVEGGIAILI